MQWPLTLYHNPPVLASKELTVSNEDMALIDDTLMGPVRKRIYGEGGVRIEKFPEGVDPEESVCVNAPADMEEPFYIAQVILSSFVFF